MIYLRAMALAFCLFATGSALAVIETYEFSNVELQERYQLLSAELRCPKCQNQNIADSNAPIAQDLRRTLYQQLEAGASNDEILDYMVARYGEFVRYRPTFTGVSVLLWLFPLIVLVLGVLLVLFNLRSRQGAGAAADSLSEAEQARVKRLLDESARGDD